MTRDNGLYRRRLMRAMGVAPAALSLTLVACEGIENDIGDVAKTDVAPQDLDDGLGLGEMGSNAVSPPEEAPLPIPWVEAFTVPDAGHASVFFVRNGLPFAEVSVVAILPEEGEEPATAMDVTSGFTDARGEAVLYGLTPIEFQGAATVSFDVVHLSRPEIVSETRAFALSGLVPNRPELTELHPLVDPHGLAAGERRRTCVPLMEYDGEVCPAIEDFHPWEALEVVSYALDDTLPASLSALACQSELTYEDSCCYFVEFWDTVNGSAADACVPANPQGGGGGGGGGWGWDDGRPFTVQGVKVKAPAVQGSGWSRGAWDAPANLSPVLRARAAAAWLKTAQAEHSSVASFSRFNLQLLEMGAPAELLLRSTGAIVDEIRHARDAFGVASTLANTEYTAGPLQMDSTASSMSLKEALMDAILEGCINETVSAAFVREAARKTTDRDLAAMLERVADDEARHSELSWAFARWVLRQHPEFRQDVSDLFDTFELGPAPQEDPDRQALAELGVLTEDYQHEVATDILAHVVVPCARALLQSV